VKKALGATMFTFSEKLRVVGIVVFCAGLSFLPVFVDNPKRNIWAFTSLKELGLFVHIGLAATFIGALLFIASFIGRHKS
jgi:hypothetical protein